MLDLGKLLASPVFIPVGPIDFLFVEADEIVEVLIGWGWLFGLHKLLFEIENREILFVLSTVVLEIWLFVR